MEKRAKSERIVLRVGEIEKRQIQGMADREGKSLTDFILSRIWGEVSETPHTDALPTQADRVSVAPGEKISDLKARFGLKTASDLLQGDAAIVPPDTKARRAFNSRRRDWYELVRAGDGGWWEVMQDFETGQVWAVVNGKATEFPEGADGTRAAIDHCQEIESR